MCVRAVYTGSNCQSGKLQANAISMCASPNHHPADVDMILLKFMQCYTDSQH